MYRAFLSLAGGGTLLLPHPDSAYHAGINSLPLRSLIHQRGETHPSLSGYRSAWLLAST
jgi:hypothetical protein